mgnify:CR=1 FL=1
MAVPNTKATLKEYCLRALGKPVIDINVDDDQVDDRIDEAVQYFCQYHSDAFARCGTTERWLTYRNRRRQKWIAFCRARTQRLWPCRSPDDCRYGDYILRPRNHTPRRQGPYCTLSGHSLCNTSISAFLAQKIL